MAAAARMCEADSAAVYSNYIERNLNGEESGGAGSDSGIQ